jgi:hypothetical protein
MDIAWHENRSWDDSVSPFRRAVPEGIGAGVGQRETNIQKEVEMLEAIVIVLVVLWALGFFAFHIGGGLIHALIVIALIILIVRLLKGKRIL